ncbi:TPA: exostosin family protein [Vibrio parahaemolyticus]|nr:exostosin family protein [Vibrio parahaemolyticus]MBM4848671.1 exostosin family protein [Vibrio parahaemolyticus]MDF4384558.1 exostosin family protein [Vibrio parahaemolyticus]HCE1506881.1 exostosin family protein [Vibrio parahaemolyticus]HCE2046055.1 exostosin family protein [Vibrio parahaemolyticus]
MNSTNYPNGWVRTENVFAFPHDWQIPAKTELWAYEKLLAEPDYSLFKQYICFPWASLVDYLDHNPPKATKLLTAIANRPPQMGIEVVTFCQHIYALKLLPYFKQLGITDIYWSHKVKGQDEVEGIRLHPYPLYPVMHYKRNKPYKNKPLKDRKYLYSFIGAYQPGLYLSEARKRIFDLPKRDDAIVIERSEWHFEQDVYRNQLLGESEGEVKQRVRYQHEQEYIKVMEDTVFCLCPSGSGPNSIRLWEAIEFGCIPVVISDTWDTRLLYDNKINFEAIKECELEGYLKNLVYQ